ncbi:hypothetical protein ALQ45_102697, partial [Pseudomonas amygdali pv. morsprunorum]
MVDRGRFVGHQARRVFFQMAGADCRRLWRVVTNGLNARLSIAVMVCRQHCSITTKYEVRNTRRSASFLRRRASRPAFPRWSMRNDNLNYRAAPRRMPFRTLRVLLRRRASRPAFPRWSVRNDNRNYRAALRVACLSGRRASSLRRRAS